MACASCKQARRDIVAAAGAVMRGDRKQAAEKMAVVARIVGERIHWSPARLPGGKRRP